MAKSVMKPLLAAITLGLLGQGATAQSYPASPVTLIVGYGAGGSTDVCNRVLAQDVGKQLGQTFIIENKPGAGSSLSVNYVIRQKPDGQTIASLSTGGVLNQVLSPNVKYDVRKDITPIAMVAQYQVGVLVKADSAYQNMKDLIKASRSSGKTLSYSTAGIGTPQHLTTERLAKEINAEWVHAPYKSGPEAITAVLRGDVDFMAQTAEWIPQLNDGSLRLLSVYTEERMKGFDAPTLKELGYNLVAPSILGIFGPPKMNQNHVEILTAAFKKASESKDFQACAEKFGLKTDFKNSVQFKNYLEDTLNDWAPLLQKFSLSN